MGRSPEPTLVIKHTFLEFVEDSDLVGPIRERALTDSLVSLSPSSWEKADVQAPKAAFELDDDTMIISQNAESSALVNQSATEELKAFLGLDRPIFEESPSTPPAKVPVTSTRRSPTLRPLREEPVLPPLQEEQVNTDSYSWPQEPCSMNLISGISLPQSGLAEAWWVPVAISPSGQMMVEESPIRQQWIQQHSPAMSSTAKNCHRNPSDQCELPEDQRTTVIIRNLPNNYTRTMLLQLVDAEGFQNRYDFVYLPIDFGSQAGLGYAFVNLLTPDDAQEFWAHFEGFRGWCVPSDKVCALNWSQPIQGLSSHLERYRNSPVMHETVPDAWKPVLYYRGKRVQFPPPTKPIKAPKIRNRANAPNY